MMIMIKTKTVQEKLKKATQKIQKFKNSETDYFEQKGDIKKKPKKCDNIY